MQAVTVPAEGGEGVWATAAPIIPHPLEFFFGLVCFAILYVVVSKKVVPRLEQIYAERTAAIEGGMNKAEEAQAQARMGGQVQHAAGVDPRQAPGQGRGQQGRAAPQHRIRARRKQSLERHGRCEQVRMRKHVDGAAESENVADDVLAVDREQRPVPDLIENAQWRRACIARSQ